MGGVQMFKFKFQLVLSTFIICMLAACGGGGSGNNSATTFSGQFIDSPTQGLKYSAMPSGLTGTTDSAGTFTFKSGDSVTFSISTLNGSIDVGSVTPPSPVNTSSKTIVHVLSIPNGAATAQILQSLSSTGANASVLDLSNVATMSAAEVQAFNDYISSGGATTAPTVAGVTFVSKIAALNNSIKSISNLGGQPLKNSASSVLSGKVLIHSNITELVDLPTEKISGNVSNSKLRLGQFGISYFKADGNLISMCVNSPWIDPINSSQLFSDEAGSGNDCGNDFLTTSQWSAPSGTTNKITTSDGMTLNFAVLDEQQGIWTGSVATLPNPYPNGATGSGIYTILRSDISIDTFKGKTIKIGGQKSCSNGFAQTVFNASGTGYRVRCDIDDGNYADGTAVNSSIFPGMVELTDSGETFYIGLKAGSSLTSGTIASIYRGTNECGVEGYPRATNPVTYFSLNKCGRAEFFSFQVIN